MNEQCTWVDIVKFSNMSLFQIVPTLVKFKNGTSIRVRRFLVVVVVGWLVANR